MAIEKISDNGLSGNRVAKAWVNFDQTVPQIDDSFNVSSVTDNAVGDYTVNFTVSFANSDFVGVATNRQTSGNVPVNVGRNWSGTQTESAYPAFSSQGTTRLDMAGNHLVFFGDQ